jgi:hypothetical protein
MELNEKNLEVHYANIKTLKTIPRFERAFREQNEEEREKLIGSLKTDNVKTALKVWKNGDDLIIIDGHNRYKAAVELELKVLPVQYLDFENEDDAYLFMVQEQLGRRNLEKSEVQDILSIAYNLIQDKSGFKGNKHIPGMGDSAKKIAEEYGFSRRTVQRADEKRKKTILKLQVEGFPITDSIFDDILSDKIHASMKDLETVLTLENETALKIFEDMVKNKILKIPPESLSKTKTANPSTPLEADAASASEEINYLLLLGKLPDSIPENYDGVIYDPDGFEDLVGFEKKYGERYPYEGTVIVRSGKSIFDLFFLFGEFDDMEYDIIFDSREEFKDTYNLFTEEDKTTPRGIEYLEKKRRALIGGEQRTQISKKIKTKIKDVKKREKDLELIKGKELKDFSKVYMEKNLSKENFDLLELEEENIEICENQEDFLIACHYKKPAFWKQSDGLNGSVNGLITKKGNKAWLEYLENYRTKSVEPPNLFNKR